MTPSPQDIQQLEQSDLFDPQWYCATYPDVALVGLAAADHYLRFGRLLQREPGPKFDAGAYLRKYPDVANSGLNPLLHYLAFGRAEGRVFQPQSIQGPAIPALRVADTEGDRPGLAIFPGALLKRSNRPTVLVCAHQWGDELYGGERSFVDILDGFCDIGFNLVITVPGGGNEDYLEVLRARSTAVVAFRYPWWLRGGPVDESRVAGFADIIARFAVDAVHANTIMLREPLIAARRLGVPAVVHVRELVAHDVALLEEIGESCEQIIAKVTASTDYIIANSRTTARAFPAGLVHVVPNTVDCEALDLANEFDGESIRIALISSNLPKKGIHDFAEVARLLEMEVPKAQFVLVGPDNEHIESLRQQQAAGVLPRNLRFAGYRDSPAAAIAEANIVVSLSHFQESFGRTVLEAMAARRPVVVYDWGAPPELVTDGDNGFVVPFRDVAAVADRIRLLCRDPQRLIAMGRAGRERALVGYDKPQFAQHLQLAYDEILAPTGPPPKLTLTARDLKRPSGELPKPRIAYFLWHFPVPSETFVLNELRILVEQGHDVHVYCRQSPHADFRPDFAIAWEQVDSPEALAARLTATGRTIVHSHFTYPTVTDMVWPACEQAGISFTFIAHAQDIFRYSNDEKNRIGEIGRSVYCRNVFVPSRFHRDYLIERGVPAEKLFVNPNGINPELYRDAPRTSAAGSGRSLCAVHRFTAKKGLDRLIEAGALLAVDGVEIHLYGYGELEDEYRRLIAERGLGNVHLHGPVHGRAGLLEVFGRHDLFVCPSVRAADGDMDGIPTVLMEAMASGLPVLATDISGIGELVQEGVTGLVCEADPESIAAAVRRFLALAPIELDAIIEAAADRIRRDYDVRRLTSTLLRVWQQATVDLLIVSWNNLPQLQEVIRRLFENTALPFHLVVCDNGSQPDVGAHLCELYARYDNVTVVFNRENALVGPGTNICLDHSWSDYAIYVCGKEGFTFDRGWEIPLVRQLEEQPDIGLTGTICHSPSYLFGRQYPTGVAEFPRFRNQAFATDNGERRFGHVQGGFFGVRRRMYEQIGGFSNEVPHAYTDVEYSFYVESRGWRLGSAPGMLVLFNKTRPGIFSRVDDSVAAIHPPTLDDLPVLDQVTTGNGSYCNLCAWHGATFVGGEQALCGACGSTPADRTLYRYLAESTLTYRQLPGLAVDLGPALHSIWQQQFPGPQVAAGELLQPPSPDERLAHADHALKLIHLNLQFRSLGELGAVATEAGRRLADDGVLLVRLGGCDRPDTSAQLIAALARAADCRLVEQVRYHSAVLRFDRRPLYVCRRRPANQCVS